MRIGDKHYRSIWLKEADPRVVSVIDQRKLPFVFEIAELRTAGEAFRAIKDMIVRGAPLIGVTAAFGIYLGAVNSSEHALEKLLSEVKGTADFMKSARPTAVNLQYAVDLMIQEAEFAGSREAVIDRLFHRALQMAEEEVTRCRRIGEHGLQIIQRLYETKKGTVNILTHCNAGWLGCVDYGTATAPVYMAQDAGIPVHVWVSETRPRNQGARLTAFELGEHGVPHTVIVDSAAGHLMQSGQVDVVIVGSDRTALNGDTANKIGTYLKALAAHDNHIPFYVAVPVSSIDWSLEQGEGRIPVEERSEDEVRFVEGLTRKNRIESVRITPPGSRAVNYGFDITPAEYITGLITDRGVCKAELQEIRKLKP